ncbi:MAG: glutaredoxin family protein [Solirubrobacterales bacterium]
MSQPIVLYSSNGCPLCGRYRAMFDEQGVLYDERNITEDPSFLEELNGMGMMATPVVVVGDQAIPGYRPNTITDLLAA